LDENVIGISHASHLRHILVLLLVVRGLNFVSFSYLKVSYNLDQ